MLNIHLHVEIYEEIWKDVIISLGVVTHGQIKTGEKAKVVAAVWGGQNLFNSLLRLEFFTRTILKNMDEFILIFKS